MAIEHVKSRSAEVVTVSAGYSVRLVEEADQQNLFREADEALYLSKTRGKNQNTSYQMAALNLDREK